jgi:hypothetical protein
LCLFHKTVGKDDPPLSFIKEEAFPWEIIDHGIDRKYLWEEYQRALEARPSPQCQPDICRRCGICR